MLTDEEVKYIQQLFISKLVYVGVNKNYDCKLLQLHLRKGLHELIQIYADVEVDDKLYTFCAVGHEVKLKQ